MVAVLVCEAEAQGHNFMRKLKVEWVRGQNQFNLRGEAIFGLCTSDGNLIGTSGVNIDPYVDDPSVGRVRYVYIINRFRGRGYGKLLVSKIMAHSKLHFQLLRLRTQNPEACYLYKSLGFSRVVNNEDSAHTYFEISTNKI